MLIEQILEPIRVGCEKKPEGEFFGGGPNQLTAYDEQGRRFVLSSTHVNKHHAEIVAFLTGNALPLAKGPAYDIPRCEYDSEVVSIRGEGLWIDRTDYVPGRSYPGSRMHGSASDNA